MNQRSYYPNYYSLTDIIATQEKIVCITNLDAHQLGFSNDDHNPEVNFDNKMELPVWGIEEEANIYFTIPDIYNEVFREICNADPKSVDMSKINKYYYELGQHIIQVDDFDDTEYLLFETCRQRCKSLMDLCKNTAKESITENRMDNSENDLYNKGCKSSILFTNWLMEDCSALQTSLMVNNHKKRKRQEMTTCTADDNVKNKIVRSQ